MCSRNSNKFLKGFCNLHQAVVDDCIIMLEHALYGQKGKLLLDCELLGWGTPLLMSLQKRNICDVTVNRLLEAGSNPSASYMKQYPIHFTMNNPKLTHELIKRGADINAPDESNKTPLFLAVEAKAVEVIYMLLCYGANVNFRCNMGYTPLECALILSEFDIAEILVDYYDFYDNDVENLCRDHIIANFLLKSDKVELFKMLWPKFKIDMFKQLASPFMSIFLRNCRFKRSEWIKCMYLMLESEFALELINGWPRHNNLLNIRIRQCTFFRNLILHFICNNVHQNDRISLIYMVCSIGVEVCSHTFNVAIRYYGFNEEFKALVYAGNYKLNFYNCYTLDHPLASCILAQENHFARKTIIKFFKVQIRLLFQQAKTIARLENKTGFFSLPVSIKLAILKYYEKKYKTIGLQKNNAFKSVVSKLQVIPSFPSLRELSRNQSCVFIKQAYDVKYTYQFYDIVKNLNLPKHIKDLILFKTPIYY